jgi:16S rRNA G966 N2-methylase RsmD
MSPKELAQIIQKPVQEFISQNENVEETKIVLAKKEILGVPSYIIAQQIVGRRKAKLKLPTWCKTKGIVYPPSINLEQSSSEATAYFKNTLITAMIAQRKSVADLTGGFGVDSFFFSKIFDQVTYIDSNAELAEIVAHNHHQLQAGNIKYHNQTAEEFLESSILKFDLIYIDPSRRDENAKKVFRLSETQPNVVALQSTLFELTDFILIKASPLLDIQVAIKELSNIQKVVIVSVTNECKELLLIMKKDFEGEPTIEAINLTSTGEVKESFSFLLSEERLAEIKFSDPLRYLYEPNSSILKSGAFKLVGNRNGLFKMDKNTHLYTSTELVKNFPGRTWIIEKINPTEKELKNLLPDGKANITTRNYPLTPEGLKKKLKLKDGGDQFLIGCSGRQKKFLLLASTVK